MPVERHPFPTRDAARGLALFAGAAALFAGAALWSGLSGLGPFLLGGAVVALLLGLPTLVDLLDRETSYSGLSAEASA